uniref:Uncharacterized protein n=1 Tax=Siphoviridae sp. cteDy1 TaxID=2825587 RepID=A0A8S5V3R8_9CAUD|nr:MAG TPA: hypothetical protein [Siphoviridae sp. cteDy1]
MQRIPKIIVANKMFVSIIIYLFVLWYKHREIFFAIITITF